MNELPVKAPIREGNLLTLDNFSTYRDGKLIGHETFCWVDTESMELRDLYTRIIDTQEEYQTEMSKSFEDYDMNITEDIDDKPRFVLSMPTFNISACGNSKDEAIQLARQMFDAYRKEDIIRRLLDIEEKKF